MADREFLLRIVGDVSSAQKSLDTLEKDVSGFKQTASNIGKTIIGAIAVDQIVQAGKAVVSAASDQEQALGALSSVFKDYSDEMEAFGDTTAENLGISKAEFAQLAAVTGSMLKNAGVPLNEVADSTQALTERAADMAAMFGGTVPEAMEAINSALKGERDPIEKYGVSLKETAVQAKAVEMGLVDAEGKVTDYGKAMATQALIMEQSADAQGTFARESGTLAGQQAVLSAQFKDLQADIGTQLMPVIVKLAGILKDLVTFVKNNSSWLIPLAAGITGVVVAVKAWQVAQQAWSIATKAATAAQWLFNAAMTANPIGLIIAAVAALAAGFVLLYTKVDWFREAVDKAVDAILTALKWVWEWVKNNWPLLLAILTGPFGAAVAIIVKNWDTIRNAIMGVYNWIKQNWPLLLAVITGPFGAAVAIIVRNWDSIKQGASSAINAIRGYVSNVANIIAAPFKRGAELARSAWDGVSNFFHGFPGKLGGFFRGLADIITSPFRSAFNSIKSLWNSTLGKISFTVPSWVPGIGGKGWSIPKMARGGIVTRPTIALIGEAGPEAVVPLGASSGFGNVTINVYALTANAEVGRKVWEALREYERINGRSA